MDTHYHFQAVNSNGAATDAQAVLLFRRGDPETSWAAAVEHLASGRNGDQKRAVLDALRRHPGSTSAELAQVLNCDRYLPARRLPELEREDLVRRSGTRVCSVGGRLCVTWEVVS